MPSTGKVDALGACKVAPEDPACSVTLLGTSSTDWTQVPFIVIVNVLVVCGCMASAEAIVPPAEQLTLHEIGFGVTELENGNTPNIGKATMPPVLVQDKA